MTADRDQIEDWRHGGFGLYLHWPFCQAKCPYCDFNSHVTASIDQKRWARAYVAEIERIGAETPDRILGSVFFGGGTPSLMTPDTVAEIMDAVRRTWPQSNDWEVTLEANPTSVEAGRFRGYRDAGVNRVSMGIQALNDADLRQLGRMHSVAEARAAFDIARDCFDRVSFDLIYARQNQTAAAWRAELTEALSMAVDHLSLYQLTIEDGTAFGDRYAAGRLRGLPDEDSAADLWDITQDLTGAAGMVPYEVSNHAREGAESKHNSLYWRYGDYVGIGPGAHGRLTLNGQRMATEAPRQPGAWIDAVERIGQAELPREALTGPDQATEYLLMSLRLTEGSDLRRYADMAGGALPDEPLNSYIADGFLRRDGDRIAATEQGRPLLNGLLRGLLSS